MNKLLIAIALLTICFASCSDEQSKKLDAATYKSLLEFSNSYSHSNRYYDNRNKAIIGKIKKEEDTNKVAVIIFYDKALVADKLTKAICKTIDSLKDFVIAKSFNISMEAADTLLVSDLGPQENTNVSDTYLVTNPEDRRNSKGIAHDLKIAIGKYRHDILFLLPPSDTAALHIDLITPDHFDNIVDGRVTWEYWHFYHHPLLAILAKLSNLEADAKSTETIILNQQLIYCLRDEASLNKIQDKRK